jgi:uncharacterized membrane protein YbhN (UPF0104 family)
MMEQNQNKDTGGFEGFWTVWRGWVVLLLIILAIVTALVVLAWTGYMETGLEEYKPAQPGAQRAKTLGT